VVLKSCRESVNDILFPGLFTKTPDPFQWFQRLRSYSKCITCFPMRPYSRLTESFTSLCPLKGIRPEWHLLKLLGVAIFPDFLSGNRTGFDEERIGFWASLDGPGLKASGPIAHLPLRDQD
jgi:hypothetical protein